MSDPARRYSWEDYFYPPGVSEPGVLRNKLGLTNYADLYVAERVLTGGRWDELKTNLALVDRTFDRAHWKAIHHHLFQDVYEWAGELRTVDMSKDTSVFGAEEDLGVTTEGFLRAVRAMDVFAGRDTAGVVDGLAGTLQGVNAGGSSLSE